VNTREYLVDLDTPYKIIIGDTAIHELPIHLKNIIKSKENFIITDSTVSGYYLDDLLKQLKKLSCNFRIITTKPGEQSKSFSEYTKIANEILSYKPDRKSLILAFGGGVIGDLAGFLAATILRGIPFIQIPTTLLAQVDSSVGGKTGINTKYGKNLIGNFYQPRLVISDTNFLKSLGERDFLSGYAEIVKYAILGNKDFFEFLVQNEQSIIARDKEIITECVFKSCKAKADIVMKDEKESGIRALLNLGHTFGHGLEAACKFDHNILRHGEAVAIGIMLAAKLSVHLSMLNKSELEKIKNHFLAMGLKTNISDIDHKIDLEDVMDAIYQDKKNVNNKLVLILLRSIGDAFIHNDINKQLVKDFLNGNN